MRDKREPNTDSTDRLPKHGGKDSYLPDESDAMVRSQRELEQQGHRQLAKVNAREHSQRQASSPENSLQETNMLEHPLLARQLYAGTDNNLAIPFLDPESRIQFENERRDQEKEKQLKKQLTLEPELELDNKPTFSPRPRGA